MVTFRSGPPPTLCPTNHYYNNTPRRLNMRHASGWQTLTHSLTQHHRGYRTRERYKTRPIYLSVGSDLLLLTAPALYTCLGYKQIYVRWKLQNSQRQDGKHHHQDNGRERETVQHPFVGGVGRSLHLQYCFFEVPLSLV